MSPGKKPPRIDPARVQQEQEEGHKAGIAFATDEAEYRDLLMLRKFLESPCDRDFAAELVLALSGSQLCRVCRAPLWR
jgi:hypothetical protein